MRRYVLLAPVLLLLWLGAGCGVDDNVVSPSEQFTDSTSVIDSVLASVGYTAPAADGEVDQPVTVEEEGHAEGECSGKGGRNGMMKNLNLSDEQQAAIKEKVEAMKAEGATHEEIHAAVGEMLKEYGIEFADSHEEGAGHAEGEGHKGNGHAEGEGHAEE